MRKMFVLTAIAALGSFVHGSAFANHIISIIPGGTGIVVRNAYGTGSWLYNAYGFSAKLSDVPDPGTGLPHTVTLAGERIVTANYNLRTFKVAVGVLHQFFAETDSSAVFVINRFDGSRVRVRWAKQGQSLPADGSSIPFSSINHIYYTDEGYLNVEHSDASGSAALVRFNPNLSFKDCKYLVVSEGNKLCGEY